jgi:hypothetical protein
MDSVGCVPVLIGLSQRDNHRDDAVPEPLVLLLPRTSFLMCVAQLVREAFASFVINIGKPLAVWLCVGAEERSVPWQYPVGALYDMLAPSVGCDTARPLVLTARMTPGVSECPLDVPLCVIGSGSGSVDPATMSSLSEHTTRERKEVQHAITILIRQYIKANLASSFGTTRHFITLDPGNSEALYSALVATEESTLVDGGLSKYQKAKEALLKQAGVARPHKYVIALYDAELDTITPKLTTISAAQVHDDSDTCLTLGEVLSIAAKNLGGADAFFSLCPPQTTLRTSATDDDSASTLSRGEIDQFHDEFQDARARRAHKDGSVLILVEGVELSMKTPASFVLKHFLGFDFRLHIVLAKRSLEC